MKVEFKDKAEQSVTTEKNYDYTTWNVGDVVYKENYPNAKYKFVGIVDNLQFFYNDLHPSPHSFILSLGYTQKEFYTIIEVEQPTKQDVVLTLEHDWEVALITSLLGALSDTIVNTIVRNHVPVEECIIRSRVFNLLTGYCMKKGIKRNTIYNFDIKS